MKKYFVCSDIHGFFDEWMKSLSDAHFDVNNKDHILIILGDIFDRGYQAKNIYDFIRTLPKNRRILVRGNHELLLLSLVKRRAVSTSDYHNGTYITLTCFGKDPSLVQKEYFKNNKDKCDDSFKLYLESEDIYYHAFQELFTNREIQKVVKWINSNEWVDYYELGKYIFVHSFIPLTHVNGIKTYNPDWRNSSTQGEIKESMWGCPYELYLNGYFKKEEAKGKILVCGHWHTSDFYNQVLYKNDKDKWLDIRESNPIFIYKGLIAIDACTALTGTINVLVINEDEI
ncbi:MAG: metallophosphoesterase [Clostridia bacterium]|nr:metallophosphoesterase [Clostridia bacterium]